MEINKFLGSYLKVNAWNDCLIVHVIVDCF